MLYVELDADDATRYVHYAPYLDYRPLSEDELGVEAILDRPECAWITRELEKKVQGHAVVNVVPEHLVEVRGPKLALIAKTEAAVKDRLTKEITYWNHRAEQLKLQEQAGRKLTDLIRARRGKGSFNQRADDHGNPQRNPLLAQQTRRLHPRHRGIPRRRLTPCPRYNSISNSNMI